MLQAYPLLKVLLLVQELVLLPGLEPEVLLSVQVQTEQELLALHSPSRPDKILRLLLRQRGFRW